MKDHFTHDLPRIASLINKIVDFDESVEQNRFVVKPGVDPVLDESKLQTICGYVKKLLPDNRY